MQIEAGNATVLDGIRLNTKGIFPSATRWRTAAAAATYKIRCTAGTRLWHHTALNKKSEKNGTPHVKPREHAGDRTDWRCEGAKAACSDALNLQQFLPCGTQRRTAATAVASQRSATAAAALCINTSYSQLLTFSICYKIYIYHARYVTRSILPSIYQVPEVYTILLGCETTRLQTKRSEKRTQKTITRTCNRTN